MPGAHVDKMFDDTKDRLVSGDKERGSEIFKEIEASSLTGPEKQEVYQRLAKHGVQHEVDNTADPALLLRADTAVARFMTDYMNKYAQNYMESVYDAGVRSASNVNLPDSVKGKMNAFRKIDGASDQDMSDLRDAYGSVAKDVIQASEQNLSLLTPEARQFMSASLEPLANNQDAANTLTANTLVLRGAASMMSISAAQMRTQPGYEDTSALLFGANLALQSYVNNINVPQSQSLDVTKGKPQNEVAQSLRTVGAMNQTLQAYASVKNGTVDNFVQGLNVQAPQQDKALDTRVQNFKDTYQRVNQDRLDREQAEIMRDKLKPFNKQIDALKAEQQRLSDNPNIGDRIKAFFKHGLDGVDGEIAKLNKKIDATQHAKDDVEAGVTVEQRRQEIDRAKDSHAALGEELNQAKGVMVMKNMEASGMNIGSTVSDTALKGARDTYDQVKPVQKELAKQIKAEERALSVREKLGPKTDHGDKSHNQGHGHSV